MKSSDRGRELTAAGSQNSSGEEERVLRKILDVFDDSRPALSARARFDSPERELLVGKKTSSLAVLGSPR